MFLIRGVFRGEFCGGGFERGFVRVHERNDFFVVHKFAEIFTRVYEIAHSKCSIVKCMSFDGVRIIGAFCKRESEFFTDCAVKDIRRIINDGKNAVFVAVEDARIFQH